MIDRQVKDCKTKDHVSVRAFVAKPSLRRVAGELLSLAPCPTHHSLVSPSCSADAAWRGMTRHGTAQLHRCLLEARPIRGARVRRRAPRSVRWSVEQRSSPLERAARAKRPIRTRRCSSSVFAIFDSELSVRGKVLAQTAYLSATFIWTSCCEGLRIISNVQDCLHAERA